MRKTIPNKTRSRKIALALILGSMTAPLAAQAPRPAPSQRAWVLGRDRALADSVLAQGLAKGLAPVLADNAVLLHPDGPVVQGAPAILRYLGAQPALDSVRITWQPGAAELSCDSTLAATWGVGVVTTRGGRVLIGRYIAVWRKEARGEGQEARGDWKLAAFLVPEVGHPSGTVPVDGVALELPAIAGSGSTAPFVRADLDFAKLAGDSGVGTAFARFAAPDAQMVSGTGMVTIGPESIGKLVAGPSTWRWYAVAAGAAADGSLGWTVGQAVITSPGGEAYPSKYVTIWRKTAAGVRYITDGGSGRPVGRP